MLRLSLCLLFISFSAWATIERDQNGVFSGRVSRFNNESSLVRFKIDFVNMKYLNKRDRVEFWNEHSPHIYCTGHIIGKSNDYLLVKIQDYNNCMKLVNIPLGGYVKLFGADLVNNLKMGREMITILQKKSLALNSKVKRNEQELNRYIEKVSAVNQRYDVLRAKLEAEWRDELAKIEEDRALTERNYQGLLMRLNEVEFNLEKYRIEDENLKVDRWSLDPKLFYKK
jgi:hypothetical protein